MTRRSTRLILAGWAVAAAAVAARAQTAAEILEKMIAAQGGKAVLAGIKDTTISGTLEMVSLGMSGSLTLYQKEPDRLRLDIEIQGTIVTQAFDGRIAWGTDFQTGAAAEMPEVQAKSLRHQALGNEAFLAPEKHGLTYAFKGREKFGDKEGLVLEQVFKDGETVTMIVDPDTYLLVKSRGLSLDQMGAEVEAETIYSDYRKVGGTTVAHAMSVFQNGTEAMRMTFAAVTFNTGLKDDLFRMKK